MNENNAVLGYRDGSPIHLTAVATLQSNTSGAGVNAVALKNPTNLPMEIYEIKFLLKSTGAIAGHSVGCKLSMGNVPLTGGFVPIFSFGNCTYTLREAVGILQSNTYVSHTMRLSRPLYVPAGGAVIPSFHHKGYTQEDITVRISYSGRNLPADYRPKRLFVPYVAAYSSKSFNSFSTVADSDNSTETDLLNPFDVPLRIERFVGRMGLFDNSPNSENEAYVVGDVMIPDVLARYTTVRMVDSNGNQIIRDYTSFANAFNFSTRAWEVNFELPSKSFYTVFLRKAASTLTLSQYMNQAFVSMVGYRELQGEVS